MAAAHALFMRGVTVSAPAKKFDTSRKTITRTRNTAVDFR
jgi:hypothetical protein